jgi:hypothetical protein
VAVRFAVANEDGTVLDFQNSRIGDGNSEDVRGEVFEACFTGTHGLGVDVPVELPELGRDLIEETGLLHFIAELGFEDDGESSDGEIEIDPGGVPEAIGGGEGATGDDVMDMGVILEGSPPGMKNAEETREISTDVILIQGEFFDSLGGGLEQGRVRYPLVLTNESAQILRDGKSEQEMVTGELPLDLFLQPLPGLMVLTSGAMAISTGAIDPMELTTLLALIKGDTTSLGATADDGINDFAVYIRHDLGVAFQVLRAEGSEDLIDCCHGPTPPSPD